MGSVWAMGSVFVHSGIWALILACCVACKVEIGPMDPAPPVHISVSGDMFSILVPSLYRTPNLEFQGYVPPPETWTATPKESSCAVEYSIPLVTIVQNGGSTISESKLHGEFNFDGYAPMTPPSRDGRVRVSFSDA